MYNYDLELESFYQAQAEEAQMRWEYEMDAYINDLYEKEQEAKKQREGESENQYTQEELESQDKFNNAFLACLKGTWR